MRVYYSLCTDVYCYVCTILYVLCTYVCLHTCGLNTKNNHLCQELVVMNNERLTARLHASNFLMKGKTMNLTGVALELQGFHGGPRKTHQTC